MRALSDRRIWPTNRNVQIEMSRAMCCVSYRRVTVKVLLFLLFRAIVAIASVCCYRNHPHRARKSYTFGSLLIARPHRTHSFFFIRTVQRVRAITYRARVLRNGLVISTAIIFTLSLSMCVRRLYVRPIAIGHHVKMFTNSE